MYSKHIHQANLRAREGFNFEKWSFFGKKNLPKFRFLILYKNGPSGLDQICVKDNAQDFLRNSYNRTLLKVEFRVFYIY